MARYVSLAHMVQVCYSWSHLTCIVSWTALCASSVWLCQTLLSASLAPVADEATCSPAEHRWVRVERNMDMLINCYVPQWPSVPLHWQQGSSELFHGWQMKMVYTVHKRKNNTSLWERQKYDCSVSRIIMQKRARRCPYLCPWCAGYPVATGLELLGWVLHRSHR